MKKNIQKYPVGTSIRYIGRCKKCKGKTGKIVKVTEYHPYIVLPQSNCSTMIDCGEVACNWENIELLVKKNQQLVFSFIKG